MADTFTRVTLFIPGTPSSEEAWNAGLSSSGLRIEGGELRGNDLPPDVSVEWVENDGHFGDAFSFGTVSPEVIEALDGAPGALVVCWPVDLREGRTVIVQAVESRPRRGRLGRASRAIATRLGGLPLVGAGLGGQPLELAQSVRRLPERRRDGAVVRHACILPP